MRSTDLVAPEDRMAERPVFAAFTAGGLRAAMTSACQAAGIPAYSPHDLRHRWCSLAIARGVPIADVARHVGHTLPTPGSK